MIAVDADRSLGEVTMDAVRLPFSYFSSVDDAREPSTRALQRSEVFQATSRDIGISAGGHFVECPARAEFEENARSCFHAAFQAVRPLDRVGDLFGQPFKPAEMLTTGEPSIPLKRRTFESGASFVGVWSKILRNSDEAAARRGV